MRPHPSGERGRCAGARPHPSGERGDLERRLRAALVLATASRSPPAAVFSRSVGHAAHFLRRLDRVSDGHVELALALYNDLELLREVLARAVLPEGAERVAISLDDPIEGPFVVVTREGRFVTCLGAGMLVSDLPIVTRERLDAAAARVERMREELGRVRALRQSGAEGKAGLAFRRMQQQGPRFAREDAETLLRVQPLIEEQCMRQVMDLHVALLEEAPRLESYRRPAPARVAKLRERFVLAFGDGVWAVAHMLTLLGSFRTGLARSEEALGESGSLVDAVARLTFEWGTFTHVTRALWFVAGGGKRALAAVKQHERADLLMCMYRELALTAIGLASEKRRAEAQKALAAKSLPQGDDVEILQRTSAVFAAQGHRLLDSPTACEEAFLDVSRQYAVKVSEGVEEPTRAQLDAVPEDVARLAFITSNQSIHDHRHVKALLVSMHALPWLVRASPAELFLPAEWAARLLPPRGVADVHTWFGPYTLMRGSGATRAPRRVEAAPGRNDPCPCGSGKKHKRCCGR